MPDSVNICEVSPRDGLQNEETAVETADKLALVRRAVAMGAKRIEVSSFVNPHRVPRLADADAVFAGLERVPGVAYSAVVMNDRGLQRAMDAGADEVNVVVVATDTFCTRNQGMTTDEACDRAGEMVERARSAGLFSTVTIGASFGCPFEGTVSEDRLAWVLERVCRTAPDEVALADTIGCAVPSDVDARSRMLGEMLTPGTLRRLHLHDTRNTAMANAVAGLAAGIQVLDASLGGCGGCPFAPAATGNVATEDLVHMLHRMGTDTGIDLSAAIASASWLLDVLGSARRSALVNAGPFPPAA